MEKLKVGMSFEVVEVLTNGGYIGLFKIGGFTIAKQSGSLTICLSNESDFKGGLRWSMRDNEVKPIGRLTITSIK